MSSTINTVENDHLEIVLNHRIEQLQGIICYLLSRNEELSAAVRQQERLQPQPHTQGEEEQRSAVS
jgi:hypothetical protein